MMEAITTHLLKTIPFEPDLAALKKRLRLKENTESLEEFNQLLDQAISTAQPRAFYMAAFITSRGEDWIEVAEKRFSSRVLSVNTEHAYRVFPYLATCGEELQQWAEGIDDVVHRFWAEAIKEAALFSALGAFDTDLRERYMPGHTASMSPGSLPDWPIQQQRVLFDLFGGGAEIQVTLTDSMLMIPTKSVSGIRFPTEAAFESCQLCPREACPGRRAPYDGDLYQSRYCSPHNG
jgi:cobalamin-dependent methionine synthase I